MLKRLLPKGRQVTLNNTGRVAKIYLEGQEKTHIVKETKGEGVLLKSLNSEKYRDVYNFDIHYLTPNETGGYDSKIYSHRFSN